MNTETPFETTVHKSTWRTNVFQAPFGMRFCEPMRCHPIKSCPTPFETSTHEAGHAIVAHYVGAEVSEASIIHDDAGRRGHCIFYPDDIGPTEHLAILLAGDLAEKLIMDGKPRHWGESRDMRDMVEVLKASPLPGMSIPESIPQRFRKAFRLAVEIINEHRAAVERVALLLRKYQELTGDEIREAIEL